MQEAFGPYELIARIGMGGMAEVFLAKRREAAGFVKDVVIKRILPAYSEDHDFVQMFHDEARLAATLRHPNIVQVTSFGEVRGQWFIELELVEGADLARLVRYARAAKRAVGANRAVQIVAAAARGLSYAHERVEGGRRLEIVHRDVSPANIMVSVHGDVKVMDFGIAKALARATRTAGGIVKGKQAYMAPEHAMGQAEQRSDIFELGICLWELLADRRLYQADSQYEYIELARNAAIPRIETLSKECTPELAAIVHRALHRELSQRYQTMREFERDLSQALFKMGGAHQSSLEEWVVSVLPKEDLRLLAGEEPEAIPTPHSDGSTALPAVSVAVSDRHKVSLTAATAALTSIGSIDAATTAEGIAPPTAATVALDVGNKQADTATSRPRMAMVSKLDQPTSLTPLPQPASNKKKTLAVAASALVLVLLFAFWRSLLGGSSNPVETKQNAADEALAKVAASAPTELPTPVEAPALAGAVSGTEAAAPATVAQNDADHAEPRPADKPSMKKDAEVDGSKRKETTKAIRAARAMAIPAGVSAASAAKGFLVWLHCPPGTRVLEGKKELPPVTASNRNNYALPVGAHVLELVFPDGVRRKLGATEVSAEEVNTVDCN